MYKIRTKLAKFNKSLSKTIISLFFKSKKKQNLN